MNCTFETPCSGLKDKSNSMFHWRRHRGRTQSEGTGPESDRTTGSNLGMDYIIVY